MKGIESKVKAGGLGTINHGLRVRAAVRAGGLQSVNHGLRVRAAGS